MSEDKNQSNGVEERTIIKQGEKAIVAEAHTLPGFRGVFYRTFFESAKKGYERVYSPGQHCTLRQSASFVSCYPYHNEVRGVVCERGDQRRIWRSDSLGIGQTASRSILNPKHPPTLNLTHPHTHIHIHICSMSVKCQSEVHTDKEWTVLGQQLDHGSGRFGDIHGWSETKERIKAEDNKVRITKMERKRQAEEERRVKLCHQARKRGEGWAQRQQQAEENETARLRWEEKEGTLQAERERRAWLVSEKKGVKKGVEVRSRRHQQGKIENRRREEEEEMKMERQAQLSELQKEERTTRLLYQRDDKQRVLYRREDQDESKVGGNPCLGLAFRVVLALSIWWYFPTFSRLALSSIADAKLQTLSVIQEKMAALITHWSTTEGDFVPWTLLQWVWWCYWWSFVWCFVGVFLGSPFLGFVMKKYVFGPRAERRAREKAAKEAAHLQDGWSPTI